MKNYTAEIQEDEDGELILELPQDMLEDLGWEPGDELEWYDNGDGTFMLSKKYS